MVFNEAVTTVTRNMIVPKVYDTITKGSPMLLTFLSNSKSWKTGTAYEVVIKYQDTTNGGNYGNGDKLDTNRENVRTKMIFEPKMSSKPVVLTNIESTLNDGDQKVLDLLETEFDSQAQSLTMLMAQNLYTGNGVGNSWDSLASAADDSTNFSTYGKLSRATYTTIKGYYLAATGALTLAKLATGYDATTVGIDSADRIVTTKSIWSTYESLLNPSVVANYTTMGYPKWNAYGDIKSQGDSLGANGGFSVLFYRGVPVVKDEQLQSGKLYFVNTNYFGFKGINLKAKNVSQLNFKKSNDGVPQGVVGRVPSTFGFNFRDLMSPVDQLAEVGHLIMQGNFFSENPRMQGQMVGVI